jgi:hypothetical protein
MNRRDAIKTLMAMPGVAAIRSATLAPDDVIVIECNHIVSDEQCAYIRAAMERVWPGRKVVVLERGTTLRIVRASDVPGVA